MKEFVCTITSNVEIVPGVNLAWLEAPHIAATAQPGQFVTLRCEDFILRRPLSIHQVNSGLIVLVGNASRYHPIPHILEIPEQPRFILNSGYACR